MYVIIAIIAAGFALFYCSYQIRLGAYVRSLCRNRAAGRVVALTFDDAPRISRLSAATMYRLMTCWKFR